jgi:hypothetical protein
MKKLILWTAREKKMKNPFFRNTEFIKENGPKHLSQLGYINIGFEGLERDIFYGGQAWFQAMRPNSPFVYTILLRRQGDSLKWLYDRIINPEAATTQQIREE